MRFVAAAVVALLICLVAAQPTAAQAGTLTGIVVSAEGRGPVSDAAVFVEGLARAALTDHEGRFTLSGIPEGTMTLVVERLGFATVQQEVDVRGGGTTSVEFRLESRALSIPEVLVTAEREARRLDQVAASVGVVGRAALEDARPSHPSEVMGRIPGVWVNITGGEGHMTAIRQPLTTDPVYLYLEDGLPTRSTGFFNHNALYEVNVPQAERIEVVKGPANALYGSDAIGGVVNVATRAAGPEPEAELSLEGGPWGFARALGSAAGRFGENGVRASLNYTRTDGWRDGTAYDRLSGTLRWDRAADGGLSLQGILGWATIDQGTAGSSAISEEDYERRPTVNYTPISFRKVTALRASLALEKRRGPWTFSATPYARSNSMNVLPNWSLTFDPAVWRTANTSVGMQAKVRRSLPIADGRVVAGLDVERSPGEHLERAITPAREDGVFTDYTPGGLLYDYDVTFSQASPYVHAEFTPDERLTLTAGMRYDAMRYNYQTRLHPVQTGSHRIPADADRTFSAFSPKLGATVRLTGRATVFGALRRGFRAPSEGQLFRQGIATNTLDLAPVTVTSRELGIRGSVGPRFRYEISAYHMIKTDDILAFQHPDGTREYQNAGRTKHRGIEVGVGALLAPGLRAEGAWSLARHTYVMWKPDEELDFAGMRQEFAPEQIGNVRLTWEPEMIRGFQVTGEWSRLGSYFLDPANERAYAGHNLLNLRASYDLSSRLNLFLRANNVADERYAERASWNAFRGTEYAPGLPRSFYVGVAVR